MTLTRDDKSHTVTRAYLTTLTPPLIEKEESSVISIKLYQTGRFAGNSRQGQNRFARSGLQQKKPNKLVKTSQSNFNVAAGMPATK